MARKRKHEEHENHERWLVSYADFITLLFAFFVVMYSVSSVNEGKFRVVSQSIMAALNPHINMSSSNMKASPLSDGERASSRSLTIDLGLYTQLIDSVTKASGSGKAGAEGKAGGIVIAPGERGIVVSIADSMAFESGKAVLLPEAREALTQLASVLKDFSHQLRVEGHTDNVPIHTEQFASNWELSATRAVNIARFLAEEAHLAPGRLAASGYGEFHPIASNGTAEGRAQNRRVEIVILKTIQPNDVLGLPDPPLSAPCVVKPGTLDGC
jgi:chemotaxis protein MotB